MHFSTFIAPALIAAVAAYPSVKSEARVGAPSKTNCGFNPCTSFDEKDQFIDVRPGSGHEFQAPAQTDIRGPCPGLNACANHRFISKTGVLDFQDTVFGMNKCLSLSHEFAAVLFVFAVFNSGSQLDQRWSIGGPMKTNTAGGLLGQGLGISNSHNKYEGDSSPGRGDAFLHKGDAHSLNLENYANLRKHTANGKSHSMDTMREHNTFSHEFSIKNNPYVFYGPGFFVAPIAHQFVVNFMSNHSKENPSGELKRHNLDSFYGVTEKKDGTLVWNKGHDRIPLNWYKRPSSNPYGAQSSFADLGVSIAKNPAIGDIGGSTGKKGHFVGIKVEDLTSGVFTSKDLTNGNALGCLAIQGLTFGVPAIASALAKKANPFTILANKILGGQLEKFSCPELTEKDYKRGKFNKYPGFTTALPRQPATPY